MLINGNLCWTAFVHVQSLPKLVLNLNLLLVGVECNIEGVVAVSACYMYRVSQKNIPYEYFANILSMIRNFFSKFYKLIIYPYLHLNSKRSSAFRLITLKAY